MRVVVGIVVGSGGANAVVKESSIIVRCGAGTAVARVLWWGPNTSGQHAGLRHESLKSEDLRI